jgi:cyclophilin family peptidyl-prolyl cis-trans isomerase
MSVRVSLIALLLSLSHAVLFSAGAAEAENTIVRFEILRGTNAFGEFDVELLDQEKPETVRNFLLYVRSGAYTNSFLHRCVPRFVIQGGGFSVTNTDSANSFNNFLEVTNYGRLDNEFSSGPVVSNTFGTIAMAKVGSDPNSATSQWFFNLANNTNLDTQNGGFTVFGRILTNNSNASNVLAYFNGLSTTAGIVNLRTLLGNAYGALTDVPVSYTTTRVPQYRELHYIRISILNRTNTPGLSAPNVQIVSPAANSSFTNQSTITISGTADDDTGVARVVYRFQTNSAQGALGSSNWQFTLTPQLGLNSVAVESIDWEGNRSPASSVAFLYFTRVPLDLKIQGAGKVLGVPGDRMLQLGTFYTFTAVPSKGYAFQSWSGAVTSSLPSTTFMVPTNATNITLTARFVPEYPVSRLAGAYKGLFRAIGNPVAASSGYISINLNTAGEFTGKILHRAGSYSFRGKFNAQGEAAIQGDVGGIQRAISLELQKTNAAGLITGSVSGTADLRLERLSPTFSNGDGLSKGRYTFAITPPVSVNQLTPAGYGYGACTIDSLGKLTFNGRLGDGQVFSGSAPVTRLRHWPLYVNLLNGRGVLLGWLGGGSTNGAGNLDGTLHWIKGPNVADATYPGGFSNQVVFLGSRYQPPVGERVLDWVHGLAVINGQFQLGISNLVKLSTLNTLDTLPPDPAAITWTLDPANGIVTGSFLDQWSGTTRALRGVVLKRTQSVLGQFVDRGTVGNLQLVKSPFLVTQRVDNVTLDGVLDALSEGGYLQFATNASVTLPQGLDLPYDTALDANGYNVVFSGGETTRLFGVRTNRIFMARGVTFADGVVVGAPGINAPAQPGEEGRGAGIMNMGGFVALTNCVLTNFFVQGGIGGKDKIAGVVAPGGRGAGAAIYNQVGRLILSDCLLADNFAQGGLGNADLPALLSTQRGAGVGAALFSEGGECQITNTVFLRNLASGGPARSDSPIITRAGESLGGALAVVGGQLQILSSEFRDNRAAGPNAYTNNQSASGAHGGALLIETNAIATNALATLDRVIFADNFALGGNSFGTQNSGSARGGAIFNGGSLQLRRSTVEQNTAAGGTNGQPGAASGGGIASVGTFAIDSSTMSSNLVLSATTSGGALFCEGGSLAATNSTFAFNQVGAITLISSNSAVIVNATVAYNSAATNGGGIETVGSSLRLRNSLLASNSPQNLLGAAIDDGYNLSSDATDALIATNSYRSVDPRLSIFSTNGGPTRTIGLLANSPARDIIPPIQANALPLVDQRGVPRPQSSRGDIGAFEISASDSPPVIVTAPAGGTFRYGTNVLLQAVAIGAQPLAYSWLKDGTLIPDATNTTFQITNFQVTADYSVIISNHFGTITNTARVTVDAKPLLQQDLPSSLIVFPNLPFVLAPVVDGPGLGYTWFQNGSVMLFNGPAFSYGSASPGAQGTYQVIITNFAGSVTSRLATVRFDSSALAIIQGPTNTTVAEGTPVTFRVLHGGIPPFHYTWFFGGTPVPNLNSPELLFASAALTNSGTYQIVVTNAYLSVTSAPAILSVLRPPTLAIRIAGTNVLISCLGPSNRLHQLFHAPSLEATQAWSLLASNIPPASGTSLWTRPLISTQNTFYRVLLP